MYRKSARGWEKHLDFMIWDQLSLQIAFLLAYMLRNGLSNPYSHLIYCNVAFILVVIDAGVLLLFESLKNVLKRGYYQEFAMTVKHVILVILVTTFYLFYIKRSEDYSRLALLYMTVLCLSLIGAGELFRAMKVREDKWNLLEITGYAGVVIFYLSLLLHDPMYQMLALILDLVLLMAVYVFTYPKYNANQVMPAFFAVVYVGVMLSYVYQTRMLDGGKFHVWLIFLCSWGCDTCAYCVGVLFGKHKMAPVLSPKKSVEGAVGGVVGAILLGIIYAAATKGGMVEYAIICGVGALISMVGDLAASAIKRNQGIKDYGKLIPGHGGILDRFDSVIFTAPIIYFLSVLLIH